LNDLHEVNGEIQSVVEKLISVRHQMEGIQAKVPPGAAEISQEDCDSDPDLPTEIRAVMGTCIKDSLDPMIRDLRDLLAYEPGAGKASGESPCG
jgi:hypothetical protein